MPYLVRDDVPPVHPASGRPLLVCDLRNAEGNWLWMQYTYGPMIDPDLSNSDWKKLQLDVDKDTKTYLQLLKKHKKMNHTDHAHEFKKSLMLVDKLDRCPNPDEMKFPDVVGEYIPKYERKEKSDPEESLEEIRKGNAAAVQRLKNKKAFLALSGKKIAPQPVFLQPTLEDPYVPPP